MLENQAKMKVLSSTSSYSPAAAAAAAAGRDTPTGPGVSSQHGSTITFHGIHYSVRVKDLGKFCRRSTVDKEILTDVSGIFEPGMNAIIGPSGGGKTTLLSILAGRKDPKRLSGEVLVDGCRQPQNFKRLSGYVVQDDIVLGTLTVRENIMFSANMRLSGTISKEKKTALVEQTIAELGLETCADNKVGTELIQGISGGERKRTSIAIEFIVSPSVLFLDEPTSGLDANTAVSTMRLLHDLSRGGRTIIFSLHQPRCTIFRLIDNMLMLAGGKTVYQGPAEDALNFFQAMGYRCEPFNNPPDFFLDVIQGEYEADDDLSPGTGLDLSKKSSSVGQGTGIDNIVLEIDPRRKSFEKKKPICEKLSNFYSKSVWCTRIKEKTDRVSKEKEKSKTVGTVEPTHVLSFWAQLIYLSGRHLTSLFRNRQQSFMQWGVMAVMALVVSIIFFDAGNSEHGIQNRAGIYFFISISLIQINLNALQVFIKERPLFIHENISGFYRVSSYFVSKLFSNLIPMRVIPLVPYTVITYFMLGFDRDAGKFLFYFFHIFLTSLTSTLMIFFISSAVSVMASGILIASVTILTMVLFGGLYFNITDVSVWIRWVEYLSILRYSTNALCINELKDMVFCRKLENGTEYCSLAGNVYLEDQGIEYETAWDLWKNELGLLIMSLFFLCFAYVNLRRMTRLT